MIRYQPDPENQPRSTFELSYPELRDKYQEYQKLSDEEFKARIVEILHLAMFICYFKEVDASVILNDVGLLHLMVHQIALPEDEESKNWFGYMRQQFALYCELV